MANPINVDIAVIGAGPVGGIVACRLANAAHSVLLVDRALFLKTQGSDSVCLSSRARSTISGFPRASSPIPKPDITAFRPSSSSR